MIILLIFIPLLTILGLIGILFNLAYKLRKERLVLTTSILLFFMTIPTLIILGLNFSDFIISIDYCKEINSVVEINSPLTNKGIGYVLPCLSKSSKVLVNIAQYDLSLSFNELINITNDRIINIHKIPDGLGKWQRTNDYFYNIIREHNWEVTDPNLAAYLKMIIYTNNILKVLVPVSECQVPINIINYGEEKVCEKNLGYMFYNLSFIVGGIICLIVLSIEINKLTVIIKLGGKKTGSLEILNEFTG